MSKKRFNGVVVSDKMQKTVVVLVDVPTTHPIYKKRIKNTKRLKAHNEMNAKIGNKVVIEESRPLSKNKNFIVVEVLK